MAGEKIFGIQLDKVVNDSIKKAGGLPKLTLTVRTAGARTAGDPAGGTNSMEKDHNGNGIIEDYEDSQIDGTVVKQGDRRVLILGRSLPNGIVPSTNDSVTIEGATYTVVGVDRDPAAASYTCRVRG